MTKVYENKYFFIYSINKKNRKTPIYWIFNNDNFNLGEIKWYASWRKFCFYPSNDTVWDNKCLQEVLKFLDNINENWKELK